MTTYLPELYSARVPKHLSFREVRRLIDTCPEVKGWQRGKIWKRNQLLLEVLWQTGCRIGEIVGNDRRLRGHIVGGYHGLRPCDINTDRCALNIQIEKRHRDEYHWVYVEPRLIARLLEYIAENRVDRHARVFDIKKRQAQVMFRQLMGQLEYPTWVTLHTLRHSLAIYMRDSGFHPFIMKEALGHANIRSTLVYGQATDDDVSREKAKLRLS